MIKRRRASQRARWDGPSKISELLASRELISNLALREIRTKYRRTALGQGWSLLNPIAQITIYSVVFAYVLRVPAPRSTSSGLHIFALWLSAALLPWLFFSNVVNSGMTALVGNANLIKKVYFPREALVVAVLVASLFTFLIEVTVLHIGVLVFGGTVRPLPLLATLLIAVLLSAFATGISLIFAVGNVYFRDTQHLAGLLLQAWFFATPIMYPDAIIGARLHSHPLLLTLYRLNPMERFAEAFRDTIYNARLPSLATTGYLLLAAAGSLLIGHAIFRRLEGRLAEEL